MKRLTGVNQSLQRGLAASENVFRLIDEEAEADSGTHDLARAKGRIDFSDVNLTYPGGTRPALDRVSFTIQAGETVALVGASGAGKSHARQLLPRFYSPDSGQILLDGVDIATLRLASLRANIALVSQDIVLLTIPSPPTLPTGGSPDERRRGRFAPPKRPMQCSSSARCPTGCAR